MSEHANAARPACKIASSEHQALMYNISCTATVALASFCNYCRPLAPRTLRFDSACILVLNPSPPCCHSSSSSSGSNSSAMMLPPCCCCCLSTCCFTPLLCRLIKSVASRKVDNVCSSMIMLSFCSCCYGAMAAAGLSMHLSTPSSLASQGSSFACTSSGRSS